MSHYFVEVTRQDQMWVADIRGLAAATDVLNFRDLDVEVRDLISGLTDEDPNDIELSWTYLFGVENANEAVRDLLEAEDAYAVAERQRDQARLHLIKLGKLSGLSERAIGDVLGMSHQRVNQLAKAV